MKMGKAMRTAVAGHQRGFGLVELMVAITLGFIVVAAVGYLYLGSRQAFRSSDNMARMQENARYALDTMSRDIRMAGYVGCANLSTVTPVSVAPAPAMTAADAISGWDTGSGPGTTGDAIQVMAAVSGGVQLTAALPAATAEVKIHSNPFGFKPNDILALTGCNNVDLVKASAVAGAGPTTITHLGARLGAYAATDMVMKVEQYAYFISGMGLMRSSLNEGTAELIDGIQDMQILYGVDTDATADGTPDVYQNATAIADWRRVVSVRISLLMASQDDNVVPSPQTYSFDTDDDGAPNSIVAADRRLYQVFTTTVGIRNRLN